MPTDPEHHKPWIKADRYCWEFTCEDCGIDVFMFSPEPPSNSVCLTCKWIREMDVEDKQKLRDWLHG